LDALIQIAGDQNGEDWPQLEAKLTPMPIGIGQLPVGEAVLAWAVQS